MKYDLETRVEALEKEAYAHLELEKTDNKQNGPAEILTQDLHPKMN